MKEDLNKKSWEEQLREAAGKVEVPPAGAVWEKVKEQLPVTHRRIYFYRWAVAAALLVLIGLGIYFLMPHGSLPKQNTQSFTSEGSHQEEAGSEIQEHAPSAESPLPATDRKKKTLVKNNANVSSHRELDHSGSKTMPSESIAPARPLFSKTQKEKLSIYELPPLSKISWQEIEKDRLHLVEEPSLQYSQKILPFLLQSAGLSTSPEVEDENSATESQKNQEKKLAVGLFFTPGLSYRTLKTSGSAAPSLMDAAPSGPAPGYSLMSPMSANASRINQNEKPMQQRQSWGWESGIRVALDLSKGWFLQSGLSLRETNYLVTAYKGSPGYVNREGTFMATARPMANSNYALSVSRLQEDDRPVHLQNKYLNTELPILVGRNFGNPDKVSFSVLAGAGITYLLNANSVMYAPKSRRYFEDDGYLGAFNSSLILETNLNVPLGSDFHFSIGPVLQYQLSSSYRAYKSVREFPYLIGVKTGISFR